MHNPINRGSLLNLGGSTQQRPTLPGGKGSLMRLFEGIQIRGPEQKVHHQNPQKSSPVRPSLGRGLLLTQSVMEAFLRLGSALFSLYRALLF